MPLDFPTIAFVGLLLYFSIALGFSMILLVQRDQWVPRLWAGSLWAGAVSTALFSLPLPIPEVALVLLRNVVAMLCSVLLLAGVALFVGRRPPWRAALALAGLYLLGIAWFSVVAPDLRIRLVLYSVLFIVWKSWEAWLLLRYASSEVRISTRLAAAVFLLDALVFLLRALAPINPDAAGDVLRAGLPMYITYVGGLFTTLAQCFALMLMIVERQLAQLRRLARIDPLTGALNRAALLEDGQQQLALCQRQRRPFSALMLDLDHFKQVNDLFGHPAGDAVLVAVSARLRALVRQQDAVVRWGGEEFVLVLPGTDAGGAATLVERVLQAVASHPVAVDDRTLPVTVSAGVATLPAAAMAHWQDAVHVADAALYVAKREGRNRAVCVEERVSGGLVAAAADLAAAEAAGQVALARVLGPGVVAASTGY